MQQNFFVSSDHNVIPDPGILFSAAVEQVLLLIIIKSVLKLGRRAGATTPQASLNRRLILRVVLCFG